MTTRWVGTKYTTNEQREGGDISGLVYKKRIGEVRRLDQRLDYAKDAIYPCEYDRPEWTIVPKA